ncbi:MAG: phospho-sugar mutase [Chlamydiota bacterium]
MTLDLEQFDPQTKHNLKAWLGEGIDEQTKAEIRRLIAENPQEITDSFFTDMKFGTGGLRGVMGVGSNRMNKYTVRKATQGLATYLKKQYPELPQISVLIGYDSRHNSRFFAEETVKVLVANGIKAFLYHELRPVPMVSFGVRYKGCQAGVMITASHNPPKYNGYKVYWSDGGQIVPPHDKGIIEEVQQVENITDVKVGELSSSLLEVVKDEIDEAYFQAIQPLKICPQDDIKYGSELSVVYTSLHGTGITMVPRALANWGFDNLTVVNQQRHPDGDFPTVDSPNPEEKSALTMGIEQLVESQGDILLGTDPDADRVGVVVMHNGEPYLLNGNQLGAICLYHVCQGLASRELLLKNSAFIKSIVTTELFTKIVESYDRQCFDVLPGFKWYADLINKWESCGIDRKFIFGAEDSYGYLLGTHARDKDAIVSCALVCDAALHAKLQGKTLVAVLYDLYRKFGIHRELLESLEFEPTKAGMQQMKDIMVGMRENHPSHLGNYEVVAVEDYLALTKTNTTTGKVEKLDMPPSNVLLYRLDDGSKLIIRPSGTEPKVKLYCCVVNKDFEDIDSGIEASDNKCHELLEAVKKML